MRREGIVYGLVFLGIVGAGVAWVLPRFLSREPRGKRAPTTPAEAPPATPPPEEAPPAAEASPWVHVRVVGPSGALRGPLKPVVGAEVERLDREDAPAPRLRVRAEGGVVAFGAAGHQWVHLPAGDLTEDLRVVLPEAAPPVVVRVREADGTPAADVPVVVEPAPPDGVRRTDASGAVVLDDAAPGLLVVTPGGRERRGPRLRVVAGENEDVRATLEPAWRIAGRVVAPDGRPVSGATVVGLSAEGEIGRTQVTSSDGRFLWEGPAAHPFAILASAPGWSERAVEVAPPAVGPLETTAGDVVLEGPGGRIEGRVTGLTVEAGASVSVEPAAAAVAREIFGPAAALDVPRTHALGVDGTFAFQDLPVGIPLRVTVLGAGVPLDDLGPAPAGAPRRVDLAVPPGQTLSGRVTDAATTRGVAGLVLLVSRQPRDGDLEVPGDRRVVTGRDGTFVLRGLPDGPAYVRAYAPGRRSLLRRVDLPAQGETAFVLEPSLADAERRVEGVVVDDAGAPLAGVTVRAAGVVGRTNAEGAFRLDGVESLVPRVTVAYGFEPGAPAVAPEPRGYSPVERVEVVPGGPPLKLYLPRASALRLRVLDGITDEPVSFVRALLRGDAGQVLLDRDVATVDGTVEWTGIASRGVTLTLISFDRRYLAKVGLEPGATKDLGDVRLAHGVRVRGVVLDDGGKPRAGATVAALDEGWLRARAGDLTPLRELPFRVTRSAADGSFTLEGLDPREAAAVCAWADGLAPAVRRMTPEDLRGGPESKLEVRLKRGGQLVVHLAEIGTAVPVAGAILDLEDARGGANHLDVVHRAVLGGSAGSTEDWRAASAFLLHDQEESGRYRVGPLEPGPYRLLVDHPLYTPERRNLTVLPPGEAVIGFRTSEMAADAPGTMSLLVELTPLPDR